MKLIRYHSNKADARIRELEAMREARERKLTSDLPPEFNAMAIPDVIERDAFCREISEEIDRVMSIDIPDRYVVLPKAE